MKHIITNRSFSIFIIVILLGISSKTIAQKKKPLSYEYNLVSNIGIPNHHINDFDPANKCIASNMEKHNSPDLLRNSHKDKYQIFKSDTSIIINDSIYHMNWDTELGCWINRKKEIFSYDGMGNLIQQITYGWQSNSNTWIGLHKTTYEYDEYNNKIKLFYNTWDELIDDWQYFSKGEYSYDVNGKITEETHFSWYPNINNWKELWKSNYFYDTHGRLIEKFDYDWNNNQWERHYKFTYTYDSFENLTGWIRYYWEFSNGSWIGKYREIYIYNLQNKISEYKRFYWDTNHWMGHYGRYYLYDSLGNQNEELFIQWDIDSSYWKADSKFLKFYDSNSNMIERQYLVKNYNNIDDWYIISGYYFSYDNNGNIIEEIIYDRNEETSDLTNSWKVIYEYDDDNNKIYEEGFEWILNYDSFISLYKDEYNFDENSNILNFVRSHYDTTISNWTLNISENHYWSTLNLNSEINFSFKSLSVYPNPSTGNITIASAKLYNSAFRFELLNLNGKVIYCRYFNSFNTKSNIVLPDISKGVYILRIQSKDFVKTEKLIIE